METEPNFTPLRLDDMISPRLTSNQGSRSLEERFRHLWEKKKTCWRVPINERERVSRANGGTSPTIYRTSISIFSSLPFSLIWTNLFPIYSGIGRYKVVATFIVGSARGLSNIFAIFIGKGFNRDCANSCHKYEEGNEFRFALTA